MKYSNEWMNAFYGFKEHEPAHKMSSCRLNTKKYNWGGPSGFYTTSKKKVQCSLMKKETTLYIWLIHLHINPVSLSFYYHKMCLWKQLRQVYVSICCNLPPVFQLPPSWSTCDLPIPPFPLKNSSATNCHKYMSALPTHCFSDHNNTI